MSTPYLSLTPAGGTEYVLVDGPPYKPWVLTSADWGNPKWEHQYSGARGTQGARASQGTLANRTVQLALKLTATSMDDLAARYAELQTVMEQMRRHGGVLTRRATGQSYIQYLEVITTPGPQMPSWDRTVDNTYRIAPIVELTCAPLAFGDSMAWRQTFTEAADETRFDITHDATAPNGGTTTLVDNHLHFGTGGGNLPVILVDAFRLYQYGDVRVDANLYGSAISGDMHHGVILRYIDADNWLAVTGEVESATNYLRVRANIAGVESVLSSTASASNPASSSPYWVSGWIEGNHVYLEDRDNSFPTPYGEQIAPDTEHDYALDPDNGEADLFGAGTTGKVGVIARGVNSGTDGGLYEVRCQPYYYSPRNRPALGTISLSGAIPGDSTALGEVAVTTPAANTTAAKFALVGWAQRNGGRNRCWNGGFEYSALPWSVSAVTGITASASSIVSSTSLPKYGSRSGGLTCSASDTSGATFRIWDGFLEGHTYRAQAWVRGAGSHNFEVVLGVNGDLAVSASTALTTSWVLVTVDWTPAADVTNAYVGIRADGTTSPVLYLDGVCVYELAHGAPTGGQLQGGGSYPPLYVVPAAGKEVSNGTLTTSAAALAGSMMAYTASGSGSHYVSVMVDPSLTASDDYTQNELDVEVWARINMDDGLTGVRAAAWVNPPEASYIGDTLGHRRAAHLWGTDGRPINVPDTTDAWRLVRLGVVPMAIDRDNPQPYRLTVNFTWTGGSNNLDVDYLVLTPARSRCLSPTGMSYASGGYPEFISTHGDEVTKAVQSDLSAVVSAPPSLSRYPDHGLGGSLLELPAGDTDVLVVLSDFVPDDPDTSDDSATVGLNAAVAISPVPRWAQLRDA